MAKFVNIIGGAALIGTGLFLEFVTFGASTPLTALLISAGVGMVITGIGTLLAKGPLAGTSTATRNPITPWNVVYGRARIGGAMIYFGQFKPPVSGDQWLDMVFAVACHPCDAVEALLFDGQPIQLSTNRGAFNGVSGDSFTPVQQNINISHISRTNNVVTVVLPANIPLLQVGDTAIIQNITGDPTLPGRYPVATIITQAEGSLIFTYICGGPPSIIDNEGECLTAWPDYGNKVHMEVLLGNHTSAFPGMLNGTPWDGDASNPIIYPGNPWDAQHKCLGRTVVFLRLHYSDQYFGSGLPTISFIVRGKNDIADPRTSPPTVGYTENAALCIADYLCHKTWGFKATLGSDLPLPQWIAAANTCDESVDLAGGGTERRYKMDGTFSLSMKRGLVLENLLTSCGGRLIVTAGQFILQPAAWNGVTFELGPQTLGLLMKPPPAGAPVMTVKSAYTGATGIDAYVGFYIGTIGETGNFGDASGPWLFSKDPWGSSPTDFAPTYRFDSHPLLPEEFAGLMHGTIHAQFDIEQSLWGNSLPPAILTLYEVWIDNPVDLTLNNAAGPHPHLSVTASSQLSPAYPLRMLFDGSPDTAWAAEGPSGWILFDMLLTWGAPMQILYSYTLQQLETASVDSMARDWTFEGSNDLISWWGIDQQIDQTWGVGQIKTFQISHDRAFDGYRWFRLTVTDNNGGANLIVADLHLYGSLPMTGKGQPAGIPTAGNYVVDAGSASDGDLRSYAQVFAAVFPDVDSGPIVQITGFQNAYKASETSSPASPDPNAGSQTALALANASGPFKWSPKVSVRDLFNGCKGTFIGPGNKWQSTDFPPYAQDSIHGYGGSPLDFPFGDANLAADGGDRRWLDIQLPFTISVSAAQRLAKIELLRRRQQGTGTFAFNLMLYQAMALDIVSMTLPLLGWSNKLLEIAAFRFTFDKTGAKEIPLLGTSIDFHETDPSVYAWGLNDELSPEGYQQASLPTNVGPTGSGTLSDIYTVNGT